MSVKHVLSAALAATLVMGTTTRVQADGGDFIAGAVIGGLLGAASQQPKRTTVYKTYKKPTAYSRPRLPSTQEGKEIQASLNYFGFNAGTVDGQLGQKTRNAVSSYQVYLGYPITGQLSPYEQELLISSYNRAQAGGYQTNQLVATNPEGTRGLLKVYRSEMASGGAVPSMATMPGTMAGAPNTVAGTTVAGTMVVVNPAVPQAQVPETTAPEAAVTEVAAPNAETPESRFHAQLCRLRVRHAELSRGGHTGLFGVALQQGQSF